MKDKILAFVSNLKDIFSSRKALIPKSLYAHKKIIPELERDENSLSSALIALNKIDDSDNSFAASLFYTFMEKVVPIMTNWKTRLKRIKDTQNTTVSGHIKVFAQYKEMKQKFYDLAIEANSLSHEPFVQTLPDVNKPAKTVITNYNRESFLALYEVQQIESQSESQERTLFKGF